MNQDRPMISVVIPSYNSEGTIRACLDSLADQSFPPGEIILVDSSADRTAEIAAREYPAVRLIDLPEQTDPGRARNLGIEAANGEVIAFIDSDCCADPEWLALIHAAHLEGHPVVGGAVINADRRGQRVAMAGYIAEFRQFLPGRRRRLVDHIPTCNISYRRSVLGEAGPFQGEFYPQEDLALNRNVREHGHPILFDPAILVAHHHRSALPDFLAHQRRIGRVTATVMRHLGLPGSAIVRHRLLGLLALPLLIPVKFLKTLAVFSRYQPGTILRSPLSWLFFALGLGWWASGFIQGAFGGKGRRH